MRTCPVSERCLARESASRVLPAGSTSARATAPRADRASSGVPNSIESVSIRAGLRDHDGPILDFNDFPAGGTQFPAAQPHSAAVADPVHRLVQPDRAAAGPRSVARGLALFLRPRP